MNFRFKPRKDPLNTGVPHRGEFWLAKGLPYEDGINSKDRPVLIVKRKGETFLCFKCTSQASESRERYAIVDLVDAGLVKQSYIDYQPILVPKEKLKHRLGEISQVDMTRFGAL